MNYITTNIRIPEEDYKRLKLEAFESKKSLSAIIRGKISENKTKNSSEDSFAAIAALRIKIGDKLKGFDVVEFLRNDRYEGHKIKNY